MIVNSSALFYLMPLIYDIVASSTASGLAGSLEWVAFLTNLETFRGNLETLSRK